MRGWAPPVLLFVIASIAVWVHRDATRLAQEGSPVVLRSWFISLDSPQDWTIACVFGCPIFFPLYLLGRRQDV